MCQHPQPGESLWASLHPLGHQILQQGGGATGKGEDGQGTEILVSFTTSNSHTLLQLRSRPSYYLGYYHDNQQMSP